MVVTERDCLVIGGGAAGASLALLLARRGVSVALVDDGRAHYSGPYETVLASTRDVWERMGILRDVRDGIQVDPLRHGAIWGQDELAWRDDPEPGLLLQRGAFDRALRSAAARAGADVREGARAAPAGDCWQIGDDRIAPRFVAFATGRRQGVAGLACYRRSDRRTIAVTLSGLPASRDRGTAVVEAVPNGWLWTHAPAAGPASVAALLDANTDGLGVRAQVDGMLADARGPAARLREVAVLRANDASPRTRSTSCDGLVLGDAAGTIDPLASQGVEKAVAAADHASAAIATALEQPEWWPRLCAVHARWERDLCAIHWLTSAGFYDQERRFEHGAFWAARRSAPQADPAAPALPRSAPVRWRDDVDARRVLMRHGDRFVEVEGLFDRGAAAELARVGRLPVAALFELFRDGTSTDAAMTQARSDPRLVVVSPRDIYDGVQWLHAHGWLVTTERSGPAAR